MAITRSNPFQELVPLTDAVSRLVEETVVDPGGLFSKVASTPLDIYADGDAYVIELAVPGLNPEAIDISVLGTQVTISGQYPTAPEDRRYLFRERATGRFQRTVTLPTAVDADKAEAHFEHGLLKLSLPKAESARPRRIAIANGTTTAGALTSGSRGRKR